MNQAGLRPAAQFLLVEDNDDHADLVMRVFRTQPSITPLARVCNGQEAMGYLRRAPPHVNAPRPDVVLLDLKLPQMDGHEVLAAVKGDPDLNAIPVVVLTTSAAETDQQRAYSLGANSYLVKPLDFDRFRQMVRDLQGYWANWNEPARRA